MWVHTTDRVIEDLYPYNSITQIDLKAQSRRHASRRNLDRSHKSPSLRKRHHDSINITVLPDKDRRTHVQQYL